ncbi:MAG TPA: M23 family metallopeptidase [Spirochaetia bacterium]|nr:M23 family metallopeptidase [Spirochaetia bacterium]HRZ63559.1 M23 family metallopeptidase [Spirochaetia bacterium]
MDRQPVFLRAVAALCLLGIALAAGSTVLRTKPSSLAPSFGAPGAAPPRAEALVLGALFSPKRLAALPEELVGLAARDLARAARDSGEAREELARAFPPGRAVLALLALDRDVDDFVESSDLPGPAGEHYREAARLASEYRPLRAAYETLYAAAYEALAGQSPAAGQAQAEGQPTPPALAAAAAAPARARPCLAARGAVYPPARRELPLAHPYALDVFFTSFDRRGEAHIGPRILSLSPGIVVASAADWRGGAGPAKWKSGGLSPAAGNGLVIYNPVERRYYSYFHLHEVQLLVGQTVESGTVLGRGGNTGMNARRPNHGGHVHLEVFDAAEGRAWSAEEILDFLFA